MTTRCVCTSVSFRAFISAAIITADADCVLSVCLTIMCLFHSPWSWLLLSSPLLQRNESVCDVGWLLTVCPMTHIGVVLLSQHISIPPLPLLPPPPPSMHSAWVVPKPVSRDIWNIKYKFPHGCFSQCLLCFCKAFAFLPLQSNSSKYNNSSRGKMESADRRC